MVDEVSSLTSFQTSNDFKDIRKDLTPTNSYPTFSLGAFLVFTMVVAL
jgi:hypothetical protein